MMTATTHGRRALVAVLAAGVLAACGSAPTVAADADAFKSAYEAADAERKKAAELSFEWRDTAKMLGQAKKLAEKGDFDGAIELANKAKAQGELAQAQAKEQESGWKAAVLQ